MRNRYDKKFPGWKCYNCSVGKFFSSRPEKSCNRKGVSTKKIMGWWFIRIFWVDGLSDRKIWQQKSPKMPAKKAKLTQKVGSIKKNLVMLVEKSALPCGPWNIWYPRTSRRRSGSRTWHFYNIFSYLSVLFFPRSQLYIMKILISRKFTKKQMKKKCQIGTTLLGYKLLITYNLDQLQNSKNNFQL